MSGRERPAPDPIRTRARLLSQLGQHLVAAVCQPIPLALLMALIALMAVAEEPASIVEATPEAAARSVADGLAGAMSRAPKNALEAIVEDREGRAERFMAEAEAIGAGARQVLADELQARGAEPETAAEAPFVVFVSEEMEAGELAVVDALAAARGDVEVVYRGIAPGETIADFARRRMAAGREVAARVSIDPRLFREHGVDAVPAVLERKTGKLVFGAADPEVLAGAEDRERVGVVVAIAEPDLLDVVMERLAAIDWEAKARAAVARVWERALMVALTPAPEDAVRTIDARIRLAADFALPDGRVVHPAGSLIDPTAALPFTLTLIVFDGRSEAELPLVEAEIAEARRPVLMVSELDRVEGWDALRRLEARLGEPVYLLPAEVRDRFRLRHTVSVVTGSDGVFTIRELAAPETNDEEAEG